MHDMSVHGVIFHSVNLIVKLWTWIAHVISTLLCGFESEIILEKLLKDTRRLKQIPEHVAIVIAENSEFSYSHLANFIVWCSAIGTNCVSIYDHDGLIKQNKCKLRSFVDESYRKLFGPSAKTNFCYKTEFAKANGHSNGFISKINLLSHRDGQRSIVLLAREMSAKNSPVQDEILQLILDEKLIGELGSWPDVLINCGESNNTVGFLPWHLHLTEIMYIRTHRHITYSKFLAVLTRFSRCEQRCGK